MKFKKIWNTVLSLLFPPRCPACDRPLALNDRKKLICSTCANTFRMVDRNYCMRCGKPFKMMKKANTSEYCNDCLEREHRFVRARALYEYSSIRDAVYRFKYGERAEYADFFGREMAKYLGKTLQSWNADAIVPVPLHFSRKNKRGYNQAELLANVLGEELGIPVLSKAIKRQKKTIPQKFLGRIQRQNNLKNAFKITPYGVKLKTIIVIDDIYTTGSTMDAVADAFLAQGAKKVYGIALSVGSGQ